MGSFKPNPKVTADLERRREYKEALRPHAERVMAEAEHHSPIGASGDYIHGFVMTELPVAFRIGNTDYFAHLVEWGSVNNPPYAPLRRGVRAAGLELRED